MEKIFTSLQSFSFTLSEAFAFPFHTDFNLRCAMQIITHTHVWQYPSSWTQWHHKWHFILSYWVTRKVFQHTKVYWCLIFTCAILLGEVDEEYTQAQNHQHSRILITRNAWQKCIKQPYSMNFRDHINYVAGFYFLLLLLCKRYGKMLVLSRVLTPKLTWRAACARGMTENRLCLEMQLVEHHNLSTLWTHNSSIQNNTAQERQGL